VENETVSRPGRICNIVIIFLETINKLLFDKNLMHSQTNNIKVCQTDSSVDWIGLAQDRYRWRALVNSVMNLRAP
jgi:hypothetical protein